MLNPDPLKPAQGWTPSPSATAAGGVAETRNGSFEALRVLGALGIVLFHTGATGAALGYAALPMFILMSLQFQLEGGPASKTALRARVARFLVPFAGWSAIYAAALIAEAALTGAPLLGWLRPGMLLTGPALHLWFLPFMAVFAVLFALFHRPILAQGANQISCVFALVALPCFFWLNTAEPGWGVAQWVFGLPAVLLAPLLINLDRPDRSIALVLWYTGLLCAAMGGVTNGPLQLGVALVVVLVANSVHLRTPDVLLAAAKLSLGIYLVHPLVAAALNRVSATPPEGVIAALWIFAISAALVALLRRTGIGRRIT